MVSLRPPESRRGPAVSRSHRWPIMHAMTPLWALLAVFVAGTVKGTAGLGFPTLATPLLSLAVDVKTAVVVLILPNIVMDGIQFARRGASTATIRRLVPLLVAGAVGTVLGTRLLIVLPTRAV